MGYFRPILPASVAVALKNRIGAYSASQTKTELSHPLNQCQDLPHSEYHLKEKLKNAIILRPNPELGAKRAKGKVEATTNPINPLDKER